MTEEQRKMLTSLASGAMVNRGNLATGRGNPDIREQERKRAELALLEIIRVLGDVKCTPSSE